MFLLRPFRHDGDRAARRGRRFATTLALVAATHLAAAGTVSLVLLTPNTASAQKSSVSTQKLIDQAKEKFDDQQYDESIQKLSAALLRPDATKAQKLEVYRWLAYNYIVLKQDDAARTAIYALYAIDEDYELPQTESPKFREPFTKYKQQWIDEGKPGQEKVEKPPAPVVLKHLPATEVPHDRTIAISGTLEDPEHRVAKVKVFYRTGSSGKFVEVPATLQLGSFQANIPSSAAKPPIVEYYVQANDEGGLAIASRGDAETPLRIAVQGDKETSIFGSWWFWTGATAVVAGGVLGAYFLTRKNDTTTPGPGPNPGNPSSTVTITIHE